MKKIQWWIYFNLLPHVRKEMCKIQTKLILLNNQKDNKINNLEKRLSHYQNKGVL